MLLTGYYEVARMPVWRDSRRGSERESARDFLDLQDPQAQILSKLLASLSQKITRLFRSLPSNFKMILKADYVDERVVWVVGERREVKRLPVTHFLEMHNHGNWRWG